MTGTHDLRRRGLLPRVAGRTIGTITSVGWSIVLVASIVSGPDAQLDEEASWYEGTILATMVILNTAALASAFVKETLGSRLLIITAIAFGAAAIWMAGHNRLLAAWIAGGPYLVSGVRIAIAGRSGHR